MSAFVFDNTTLWLGDGGAMFGHVVVRDGRIEAAGPGRYRGELPVTDLEGLSLSPGLIDLMLLGAFDRSVLHDSALDIARGYLRLGVTAMQTCIGTLPWDLMGKVASNVREAMACDASDAAHVLGLYLEGPFQHPDLTGASLREHALPPTPGNVERIVRELGEAMTMINVAPGTEGDAAAVRRLRDAGKIVTMAHSNAPAQRVLACIDAGTSVLGHVFDNNSGLIGDSGVQQPTIEHVAFVDERVRWIHLICDGVHVHPLLIKLILRCRGLAALCIVSDGNQRLGMPDGPFQWADGQAMYKIGGVCRTADRDWLAGSATPLPEMFRKFVRFTGLEPHEAIRTVTLNPARSLGLDERMGIIAPGRLADLVAWDSDLQVRRVWRQGVELQDVQVATEVEA